MRENNVYRFSFLSFFFTKCKFPTVSFTTRADHRGDRTGSYNNLINAVEEMWRDIADDNIDDDIYVESQAIKEPLAPSAAKVTCGELQTTILRKKELERDRASLSAFTSIVNSPAINVYLAIRFRTTRVACSSRTSHVRIRRRSEGFH